MSLVYLLCIYYTVDISDSVLPSYVFWGGCTQDSPVSKQTDVSILAAQGWLCDMWRVCLHVDVSTLIQTPVFSSHLSAPDVALGVKVDLCSHKKKGGKQHIFLFVETDRYTLKFNSGMQVEMSPIQVSVSLDATADFISCLLSCTESSDVTAGRKKKKLCLLVNSLVCLTVFDNCALIILSVPCNWPFFVVPGRRLMTS